MDENIYFENLGYTVSDNDHLLDEKYNLSTEIHEIMDDAFYFNEDCGDPEDEDDTPTFTKQVVHIHMYGEETNYQ